MPTDSLSQFYMCQKGYNAPVGVSGTCGMGAKPGSVIIDDSKIRIRERQFVKNDLYNRRVYVLA